MRKKRKNAKLFASIRYKFGLKQFLIKCIFLVSFSKYTTKIQKFQFLNKILRKKCWDGIVYYVPRHTMRVIAWRATMFAGDRSQGVVEARAVLRALSRVSQFPELCALARILSYVPPARKLVFSLQLTVAQCSILRYRGMECKNWTAHAPIAMQQSTIFFLFFFFVQRWHRTGKALYIWTAHASTEIHYYYTISIKSKWPGLVVTYQV